MQAAQTEAVLEPWPDAAIFLPTIGPTVGRAFGTTWLCLALSAIAADGYAQTTQVSAFGGYWFGGDPYSDVAADAIDIDNAASVGGTVDVFFEPGRSVTFVYSHSHDRLDVVRPAGSPTSAVRVTLDHWLLGGTQEVGTAKVRPFYLGLVGLTHLRGGDNSETRFSVAGGGGVKLLPSPHFGLRLDGRVYAIFLDADSRGGFCGPSACVIGLDVSVAWQTEFSAGAVVSF
jgi:hypothetical protein